MLWFGANDRQPTRGGDGNQLDGRAAEPTTDPHDLRRHGLAAFSVIHHSLTFRLPEREHRLDIVGASILVISVTSLILGLAFGGTTYAWGSWQVITLLSLAAVGAVAFVGWELRAPEPLLPMRLFRNPTFRILIGGNAAYGAAGMGMMSFLPLFFQVSLGEAATTAGLIIASSSVSVSLGSYISGRVTTGTGRYRRVVQIARC